MLIEDGFEFEDRVSGLKLTVTDGKGLDILHIEHTGEPITGKRDFFFTKEGQFDGTGSKLC